MTSRITRIVTHVQPHFDELVAIYLLRTYGEQQFPGVRRAQIEFWSDRQAAIDYAGDDTLFVGIGGGIFDEHPVAGKPRDTDDCATTLVAKVLKRDRQPDLKLLIAYTAGNDIKGKQTGFEIAEMVRLMNLAHPEDSARVWRWTLEAIRAYHNQQREFHRMGAIFARDASITEVPFGDATLKVVAIQTDNRQAKAYAFSRFGGYAGVIIQRNGSGNIQIFANQYHKVDFVRIAEAIRQAELAEAGASTDSSIDYTAEGTTPDVPYWYYFAAGQMLLNGSHTSPDTPPSALSLEAARGIVLANLRPLPQP